jgi:hypothetical protein
MSKQPGARLRFRVALLVGFIAVIIFSGIWLKKFRRNSANLKMAGMFALVRLVETAQSLSAPENFAWAFP